MMMSPTTTALVPAYPGHLDRVITLPNKRTLRVRALHRGEEEPIRDLFANLSPRSRYMRFLSPMSSPDPVLRVLSSVDYRRRLALIAEHETAAGRETVGLVNFGAIDERTVEVGLVVRDAWQQQRIGTLLAVRVLEAAEECGYHRFVAHLLAENVAIRKLLARVGEVVSVSSHSGVSELMFVRRQSSDLFVPPQ